MQQVQLASITVQIAMKLKKENQEPAQTHTQRTVPISHGSGSNLMLQRRWIDPD